MAIYVDKNLGSWTIDRSYAVAAFRGFSKWAAAVGDRASAATYAGRADAISKVIAAAQDHGGWRNYFDYLDGGGHGVYNQNGVDQTGFSPYEFNARPCGEAYAAQVSDWWDHGKSYNDLPLTVQTGPKLPAESTRLSQTTPLAPIQGICSNLPTLNGRLLKRHRRGRTS